MSNASQKTLRTLAGLATATFSGVALLGVGATPASAATGAQIVNIANANIGKGYCSINSAGGVGFDSSCTANGGTGEFWCGDFVSWVWQQAGVPVPAAAPAYVPSWMSTSAYHSLSSGYVPKPGDAIIFGDDQYPTQGSHISIVTNYSNGLLSDVGGDEGGGGNPWWSTSTVQVDEGSGGAWNPNNKLFAGQSYEMWVLGYVSQGTSANSVESTGPAAIVTAQGTIALYNVGTDGNVYGSSQSTVGGSFGSWVQLSSGGGFVGKPAVLQSSSGLLSLYARGKDGMIYGATQSAVGGSFGSWVMLGGTGNGGGTADPTVLLTKSGTVAVYTTDAAGDVVGTSQSTVGGAFGSWVALTSGGGYTGKPAVLQSSSGLLSLYARGKDGMIYGATQSAVGGSFGSWVMLGGTGNGGGTADPTVLLTKSGTVAVYTTDAAGDVVGTSQSTVGGAFGSWVALTSGGGYTGKPAVLQSSSGLLSLYARGKDGMIYGATQSAVGGSFGTWSMLGGTGDGGAITDPTALMTQSGTVALYINDTHGDVVGTSQSTVGGSFGSWAVM